MTASTTLRLDPGLRERLDALASARGLDPAELLAELIGEAETAQLVDEVNRELERLASSPDGRRTASPEMRRLDETVRSWMAE